MRIKSIKLCMENNVFTFNDKIYTQKTGAAMDCNLSPIIAECLVSYIFDKAIDTFINPPRILKYFVDDSFMIINKRFSDLFFKHVCNIGNELKTIKFTIEKEADNQISFLDIKIVKERNTLKTSVFRKDTHSNRYLNFNSHHSLQNRKSVIRTLVNRAFTHISDQSTLISELNNIKYVLNENNYPSKIIDPIIDSYYTKYNSSSLTNNNKEFDKDNIISIPYIRGLSEKIQFF